MLSKTIGHVSRPGPAIDSAPGPTWGRLRQRQIGNTRHVVVAMALPGAVSSKVAA